MNTSHLQHVLFALLVQAAVGFATGNWLLGGLLMVGFFVGREVSQAEYRWMLARDTNRAEMPLFQGFDISAWSLDAKLDASLPAIACAALYFVKSYLL